jgi:hypothetical protein
MDNQFAKQSDLSRRESDPGMTAFARNVLGIMERIEYRLCEGGEDLEDIFRLRYNSYLSAGMIKSDVSRMVIDDYEDLPGTYTYGIHYDGNLVCTVRFHHITKEFSRSPSTTVFGDVLGPRLAAGETFIDPSRFAADNEWSATLRVLPYITLRLPMLACHYFNTSACLQAIKGEHAAFYKRVFVAEPLVRERAYPGLTCAVDLWQSPSPLVWQQAQERFAFFRSTPLEERMLFTRSHGAYKAPLTILPSAKYLSHAA